MAVKKKAVKKKATKKKARANMPMAAKTFWELISLLDWAKAGDDDAVIAPLVEALAKRSVKDIISYQERMADLLYALDGEAYAREIGADAYAGPGSYLSADWFLYVRLCVVANGEAVYEKVLRDPTCMLKDLEFESLLYVAGKAYELKTGENWEGHATFHDYETFSNRSGWPSPAEEAQAESSPAEGGWTRLHCRNDVSDKFWAVRVTNNTHETHWGRAGTDGRRKTKSFLTASAAQSDAEKLISQKTKKGYAEDPGGLK